MTTASAPGPLGGMRVLDFTRLAPGQMATMMLADLGAQVVKVEEPGGGERARAERGLRGHPTESLSQDEERWRMISPLDRNKKSVALNLKHPRGRALAIALAARADIVVEGFRPGVMGRLGLGYPDIQRINPRVIYCSITGYGQDGPRSAKVGHDLTYLADAGALSLMGTATGTPIVPVNVVADFAAGSYRAVMSILAGLLTRHFSGEGQYVDVSMTDGVVELLGVEIARYVATGVVPSAGTTPLTGGMAHYGVYPTKDGRYLAIGCNEPRFFAELCAHLGCVELIPYQLGDAVEQRHVSQVLAERFRQRTLAEWVLMLDGTTIASAPVRGIDEVVNDDHYRTRGAIRGVESDHGERFVQVGPVMNVSGTMTSHDSLGRRPGADSEDVLREIGVSDEDIVRHRADGVIAC